MMQILIVLAVIFLMVRRQLGTRTVSRRMVILPLILLVYGFYMASSISGMDAGGWLLLILGAVIGFPIGIWQGILTKVFREGGVWMTKGSPIGLAVWLLSIPVRYGLRFGLAYVIPTHASFTGGNASIPFLFAIAGIVLGRLVGICMKHPQVTQQLTASA
ncbi:DUF1453 family protein [Paenibacillus alba]|uniref:DUF1453 family protein n=1 Tax=Paenibacillus alba TaxID=1197127 RepID=UPI00156497B1|nr:DUF1453 family protein [Paenibacillus alba]NQX66136.1 DUF1453 family protein [Paenibacillus alba]